MVWYVLRTKSRRERWAAENVERQGCKYYLPTFEVLTPIKGKLQSLKPQILFPSYLFVQPREDGSWRFLLSTFGVQSMIMMGQESPAVMPEREIARLMASEGKRGVVSLPDSYVVNDELKVVDGPFLDHVGLYQGMHESGRLKILLDVLGGHRTVLFNNSDVVSNLK